MDVWRGNELVHCITVTEFLSRFEALECMVNNVWFPQPIPRTPFLLQNVAMLIVKKGIDVLWGVHSGGSKPHSKRSATQGNGMLFKCRRRIRDEMPLIVSCTLPVSLQCRPHDKTNHDCKECVHFHWMTHYMSQSFFCVGHHIWLRTRNK